MVVESDLNRIKALLTEAVTVLCKNALSFGSELSIEGLLGITLDKQDVFLVSIHETSRKAAEHSERASPVLSTEPSAVPSAPEQNRHDSVEEGTFSLTYSHNNSYPQTATVGVKQEHNSHPVPIVDLDAPEDLSSHKHLSQSMQGSPARKRHRSNDGLYRTKCDMVRLSSSPEASMNPLDLIIKHERESDCEVVHNDISSSPDNPLNIQPLHHHSNGNISNNTTSGPATTTDNSCTTTTRSKPENPTSTNIDNSVLHINNNSLTKDDSNSDLNNVDSAGWGQDSSPFCVPANLLSVNHGPFSPGIGSPAISQIPLLDTAIFQQFNLGASLMKTQMSGLSGLSSLSRRGSLSGRTFTCHICTKVVRTNQALRDHIATHEQTKRYHCPHCEQTFVHRSSLANHRRKCLAAMQHEFYEFNNHLEKT